MKQAQLDRFFNMSLDHFAIATMDGHFKVVNDAFVRTLGYTREELVGRCSSDFVHPEDRANTNAVRRDLLQGGTPLFHFENRYLTKSGEVRIFSWQSFPVAEEDSVYAVARDVTELRQKEQLIQQQRAQMIEASRLHSLGEMAAGIAHEINNPLSVLYLSTFRLRELQKEKKLGDDEAKVLIDRMEEMTWRMTSIIKGLLTFARDGEADPVEVVNLKNLIESSVSLVEGYCRQKKVSISVAKFPSSLSVSGRAVQLSQVLVNLINNAVDSVGGSENASISIEVEKSSEIVEIKVVDSGPPLTDKIAGKIFEPFFTTKAVGAGTGLGLSISHGIAKAHGGELIYDRASPTAAFILKLPLL